MNSSRAGATHSFDTYYVPSMCQACTVSGAGDRMVAVSAHGPYNHMEWVVRLLSITSVSLLSKPSARHFVVTQHVWVNEWMSLTRITVLSLRDAISNEVKLGVRSVSIPSFEGQVGMTELWRTEIWEANWLGLDPGFAMGSLCDLGQIARPLYDSLFLSVKWG